MILKLIGLFGFFDKKSKIKLLLTQIIVLISSIFELLTIFSIGPLVQLLSNPDIIFDKESFISKVYFFLNFNSFETFLIFLVAIIFIFLFISTVILSYTLYLLSMYSQTLGNILRSSLFKFYISQPWIYHSRSNTTEYIERVFFEANRVTINIIIPILLTNSRLLTGLLVVIALTIYNPVASLICFVLFGILYTTIFKFVKSKITLHGANQSKRMAEMYRVMNESFVGIKEAIIYGNQKKYFEQFQYSGMRYSDSAGKVSFLANAPRYTLEFFAFSIIIFFVVLLVFSGKSNFNDTLPVLAVYIFAGYKLLPIFQFIYSSFVQIRGHFPAYEKIEKELLKSKKYSMIEKSHDMYDKNFNAIDEINFNKVSFSYNELDKKTAVQNLDLNIKKIH